MFFNDNTFLHIIVVIVSSMTAMSGIAESWTSPMMSKLASHNQTLSHHRATPLSTCQESLVVSLLHLGCAFGCIASIYTSPNIGRKKTVVLFGTLTLTSYLLVGFGETLSYAYCARFLAGFGSSCCLTVLPQYIDELIGDEKKRSAHNLMGVFLALGVLFSFVAGPYSALKEFSFVCTTFIALLLLIFNICVPESPLFLASLGDRAATERCLRKLRSGLDENGLQKEMDKVFARVKDKKSDSKKPYHLNMPFRSFLICVTLLCFQELAGMSIVLSFMQEIFEKTSHSRPKLASMVVGGTNLVSAVFVAWIMESVKKRHLLLVSCAGCCLSLGLFGLYFYAKRNFVLVTPMDVLPVASLVCYMLSFNAGLGHVTWAVSTEVFRPQADLLASSVAHATGKFVAFALTLSFPYASEVVGYDCYFWALSVCCSLALLFVGVFVRKEGMDEASAGNKCESPHVPP